MISHANAALACVSYIYTMRRPPPWNYSLDLLPENQIGSFIHQNPQCFHHVLPENKLEYSKLYIDLLPYILIIR